MVIAKMASRSVAFKADMMSKAVLEAQASFVTPEARSDGSGRFVRATFALRVTTYDDDVGEPSATMTYMF